MNFRLLICAPGENLQGGISAVVKGIEKGLEYFSDRITYKKVVYGKSVEGFATFRRIISEVSQLLGFIVTILRFKPSIILIESSFDKKTVLRDSVHLLVCKVFRKKVAVHAHGGSWSSINTWDFPFKQLAPALLKNLNLLIVTSLEEYQIVKEIYNDEVRIYKIDNPVFFPHHIEPTEQFNSQMRVIFASRLIETKGILDVLGAARLLRDNENITFEVFGNGELSNKLKKIIEEENLTNISLLGGVSLEDLIIEYQKGDIFLFPSYHKEGFPMALFFAVGSGLPIIATRVRPLPNFLSEGVNCMWVSEKDPQMIADRILELSKNRPLMLKMKKANIETIRKFEPKIIVKEYLDLFESVN
jgi:glycosyltransferase involved in cell wall biosynthesis